VGKDAKNGGSMAKSRYVEERKREIREQNDHHVNPLAVVGKEFIDSVRLRGKYKNVTSGKLSIGHKVIDCNEVFDLSEMDVTETLKLRIDRAIEFGMLEAV
jgi:hypothetical protein